MPGHYAYAFERYRRAQYLLWKLEDQIEYISDARITAHFNLSKAVGPFASSAHQKIVEEQGAEYVRLRAKHATLLENCVALRIEFLNAVSHAPARVVDQLADARSRAFAQLERKRHELRSAEMAYVAALKPPRTAFKIFSVVTPQTKWSVNWAEIYSPLVDPELDVSRVTTLLPRSTFAPEQHYEDMINPTAPLLFPDECSEMNCPGCFKDFITHNRQDSLPYCSDECSPYTKSRRGFPAPGSSMPSPPPIQEHSILSDSLEDLTDVQRGVWASSGAVSPASAAPAPAPASQPPPAPARPPVAEFYYKDSDDGASVTSEHSTKRARAALYDAPTPFRRGGAASSARLGTGREPVRFVECPPGCHPIPEVLGYMK